MKSQTDRLIEYVRHHPGCTPFDLITNLGITKYTSRISDARKAGADIYVVRSEDTTRYYLREPRKVDAGEQASLGLSA